MDKPEFTGYIFAICIHSVDIGCYRRDTMDCEPKYFCRCCSNWFCGSGRNLCTICDDRAGQRVLLRILKRGGIAD